LDRLFGSAAATGSERKTILQKQQLINYPMKKADATTKFEFLITLENNIVCQRFFNVKGYNPKVRRSLDLYETIQDIANDIQADLKKKSSEFLFENEKFLGNSPDQTTVPTSEYFTMQVRLGDDVIIARQFPASIYPPKVRYTVDVRPEIRNILTKISDTLSQDVYETEFNGVAL
jgi:hypothetical protein